jgi:hypothetical protein
MSNKLAVQIGSHMHSTLRSRASLSASDEWDSNGKVFQVRGNIIFVDVRKTNKRGAVFGLIIKKLRKYPPGITLESIRPEQQSTQSRHDMDYGRLFCHLLFLLWSDC